jgi:hypothetical protein
MGPQDISVGNNAGWRKYDGRDNEIGGRVREEYVKEIWGDNEGQGGEVGQEVEKAAGGGDQVGIGVELSLIQLQWERI